jgi:CheY-like chemotaxis protein/HPt (histidine-containing phosphotransfer) domain-containing protein
MGGRIAMEREHPMKPAVLLVEDDPTSAAYLAAALEPLGVPVHVAASGREAADAVADRVHALWLVDAHLPDCTGIALLGTLHALRPGVPAIAHTASRAPALHRGLVEAGFAEVVVKPVDVARWQAAVRRHLPAGVADAPRGYGPAADGDGDWGDPAMVVAVGGVPARVARLRRCFMDELPAQRAQLAAAARARDTAAMRACLHRLAASCAFVGASRLARCVERLRDAPGCPRALEDVRRAMQALEASGAGH